MKDKINPTLFDMETSCQEEWKDMPEFVQKRQQVYSEIIIRFANEEDLKAFANLIQQKLTRKTKSIWYPFRSHWGDSVKRWISES
jgi:hypothetical protein